MGLSRRLVFSTLVLAAPMLEGRPAWLPGGWRARSDRKDGAEGVGLFLLVLQGAIRVPVSVCSESWLRKCGFVLDVARSWRPLSADLGLDSEAPLNLSPLRGHVNGAHDFSVRGRPVFRSFEASLCQVCLEMALRS